MHGLQKPRARTIVALLLAVAAGLTAAAGQATDGASPLDRIKVLEGDWVSAADGDMVKKGDLVSSYRVTAAGHAVVETNFPGTSHEMVTVYTEEDGDLVLTHYCMAGNQPRMRATSPSDPRIEFAFDGGGNIADPDKDQHMHSAWLEILGPDEMRSQWTEHADGKPALVVPMHTVRKTN